MALIEATEFDTPIRMRPSSGLSVRVPTEVVRREGGFERPSRELAVEVPVEIAYGGLPYAVMMLTPGDLVDFAAGFSLTEGIVRGHDEIRDVRVETLPDGLRLAVDLVPDRLRTHLARRRAMSGRTGCGVCGVEDLAALPRAREGVTAVPASVGAIDRALAELDARQPLNALTHAVHAAAWADLAGRIVLAREDVGRHNALDKAVGALTRAGCDPTSGFLVITSRCSFEMVEKAAAFGAGTLVAISAPTSLAVERARHHGLALVAIARRDAVTLFNGALAEDPIP